MERVRLRRIEKREQSLGLRRKGALRLKKTKIKYDERPSEESAEWSMKLTALDYEHVKLVSWLYIIVF